MSAGDLTPGEYARFAAVACRLVAACLAGAYQEKDGGWSLWRAAFDEIRDGEDFDERDAFDCVIEVLAQTIADDLYRTHGYEAASDIMSARIAGILEAE